MTFWPLLSLIMMVITWWWSGPAQSSLPAHWGRGRGSTSSGGSPPTSPTPSLQPSVTFKWAGGSEHSLDHSRSLSMSISVSRALSGFMTGSETSSALSLLFPRSQSGTWREGQKTTFWRWGDRNYRALLTESIYIPFCPPVTFGNCSSRRQTTRWDRRAKLGLKFCWYIFPNSFV